MLPHTRRISLITSFQPPELNLATAIYVYKVFKATPPTNQLWADGYYYLWGTYVSVGTLTIQELDSKGTFIIQLIFL